MASRLGERRPTMMRSPRGGRPDLVSDALRQLWANAENDPVPDEFLNLLDQLDAARLPAQAVAPADAPDEGPLPDGPAPGEDKPSA
jgi:hypothetical protein